MSRNRSPDEERFWPKVEKTDHCWPWKACCDKDGYGVFYLGHGKGLDLKQLPAHRYSWILHFGPIPQGLFVLHRCDNPPCVNPAHLWLGTAKDNAVDMFNKKRDHSQKGSENPQSKLAESDIPRIFELRAAGMTQQQIAEFFGVKQQAVSKILTRKGWTHVANRH